MDLGIEKVVEKFRKNVNTVFSDRFSELEGQIEIGIKRAGRYFGIPTNNDLERVNKRLCKLERRIDSLNEKLGDKSRS